MVNAVEFRSAITRWKGERLGAAVKELQQESARVIGTKIVRKMPVLTGLARGNVRLAIGDRVAAGVISRRDIAGNATIADIMSTAARLAAYSVFTIYNNLPYVSFLENGSSKQAPLGMFRLSLREFKSELPAITSEVQRKLGSFRVR